MASEVARIDLRAMPALKGAHNWQNACMAYGAARALGLSVAEITKRHGRVFPALRIACRKLACLGHVPFINDSKATNADAAAKALASFENIFWIAGGIAKAGGIDAACLIFPAHREGLSDRRGSGCICEDAGRQSALRIVRHARQGCLLPRRAMRSIPDKANAVVLLSPACASFDHYRNFEIRGDAFVKLVSELPGIVMTIEGVLLMLVSRSDRGAYCALVVHG